MHGGCRVQFPVVNHSLGQGREKFRNLKTRRKGWQKKILIAFRRGTFIRCIGNTLYDWKMNMVGSNHDMLEFSRTHNIERMDAGGSPRWRLKL